MKMFSDEDLGHKTRNEVLLLEKFTNANLVTSVQGHQLILKKWKIKIRYVYMSINMLT